MTLKIVRRSAGEHALVVDDREIGRLTRRAIALGGFATETDALAAANAAYQELRAAFAEGGRRPRTMLPRAASGLALGDDGRLTADGRVVGRVDRRQEGGLAVSFELWFPTPVWHAVAVGLAGRLHAVTARLRLNEAELAVAAWLPGVVS